MTTNNSTNNAFPSGITLGTSGVPFTTYNDGVSWVPTVSGSTSAGTGTYTVQAGYYTQIGNMIFLSADITWTAHTGTGNLLITNLPFPARNLSNYNPESIVNTANINLPGGTARTSVGSIQPNTSTVDVYVTTQTTNSPVAMSASGTVHVTLAYLI